MSRTSDVKRAFASAGGRIPLPAAKMRCYGGVQQDSHDPEQKAPRE
jgi:hypothetical protein